MALPTAPNLLPTDIKEGTPDHPGVHNAANAAINTLRNAMIAAGIMIASVAGGTTPTTVPNPSHVTAYVAPPKSFSVSDTLVFETAPLELRDSMAVNGVITVSGRYIKTKYDHCITTNCSSPVVIDRCILVSDYGDCVRGSTNCSLTVTNTTGFHVAGDQPDRTPGRFVNCYYPRKLRVEHCQFQRNRGILVDHWGGGDGLDGNTITIRYNAATNITGASQSYTASGGSSGNYEHSQLIQITNTHVAGIEIAHNRVLNFLEQSRVEDNINLLNAGGTQASPARIHHNFVWGAYALRQTDTYFSGTGGTTDGDTNDPLLTASWVHTTDNWFIGCANSGYNIATGHSNRALRNRIIASGFAELNGKIVPIYANYCGICIYNGADRPATLFYDNLAEGNYLGSMRTKDVVRRHDQNDDLKADGTRVNYMPANGAGNDHVADGPITWEMECAEWINWQNYCIDNAVAVGLLAA